MSNRGRGRGRAGSPGSSGGSSPGPGASGGNSPGPGSSGGSSPGPGSSRNSSPRPGSKSEIDYCIRTANYLISTLGLSIAPIRTLNDLRVEHLLRIHCALHGINFESDFIPTGRPSEDVSRMILSLKDKYGSDKFTALDATLISRRNPTQVRFVLENFHLIINHQITRGSDSRHRNRLASEGTQETTDQGSALEPIPEEGGTGSSNLPIRPPTPKHIAKYLPYKRRPLDPPPSRHRNWNHPWNVVDSPKPKPRPKTKPRSVSLPKINVSAPIVKKSSAPLTSSPVVPEQTKSRSHISPNVSIIKSPSTVSNLHRTLTLNSPKASIISKSRSRSLPKNISVSIIKSRSRSMPRSIPSSKSKSFHTIKTASQSFQEEKSVQVLAKNDNFGRRPSSRPPPAPPKQPKHRTKPKPKVVNPFACYIPTSLRNWLLPVEARFPCYNSGVIISKCTSWRSDLKRSTSRPVKTLSYDKCMALATRKHSKPAKKGSRISEKQLELSEDDD